MIIFIVFFTLIIAPAVVLLKEVCSLSVYFILNLFYAQETSGRVPLTDQLLLKDLQPTLNTLKKYHYKGRQWQSLCLALGLTDDTIGVIETNHIKNVERCLKECLSSWLRKADLVDKIGGPNWETLISALRSIGENAAAEGIDKES